ncbi:ABC transporter ATP-binding protein [Shimia biformata]|uniref:iron ABC transporter ATP-binding protein n=1 Tax=Shimia biformata TaxID=1294299 RepID=UPI00194F0EB7|nr:ATP-binding cassette domain-containing protein [Shimia biformata]
MIRVDGLSYRIGEQHILSDISLDLPRGGISALVGPNGAGKSTLLSLIARLIPIQTGRITVDDLVVGQCASDILARKLAILPQSDDIAPRLTVRELIGFGRFPHHKGRPGVDDRRKVDAAIEAFDLEPLQHRPLDTLSGGQRQRSLIAMAFAQDTDYLLLDEPLNNLDIAASRSLMARLRDLAEVNNRSIVVVLHDLNFACGYADFLVALTAGRIGAMGPPSTVVTSQMVAKVFGTKAPVIRVGDRPLVQV